MNYIYFKNVKIKYISTQIKMCSYTNKKTYPLISKLDHTMRELKKKGDETTYGKK